MKKIIVALLLLAMPVGLPQADCKQSDLKGAWYLTGVMVSAGETAHVNTWKCEIEVDEHGEVHRSARCTPSAYRVSDGDLKMFTGRGKLQLNKSCNVTGTFERDITVNGARVSMDSENIIENLIGTWYLYTAESPIIGPFVMIRKQ